MKYPNWFKKSYVVKKSSGHNVRLTSKKHNTLTSTAIDCVIETTGLELNSIDVNKNEVSALFI